MNHFTPNAFISAVIASLRADTPSAPTPVLTVSLDRYPDRDLGIGYGRSSGYANTSRRSYADSSTQALLRVG